uniref:Genome polyprotein n=1 Tax=Wenling scaldfish picornavirus 2 TaxID=2116431 RepID=A0A2P1GN80_9VIRU|nr:polyprotein [Wenling scaldfish picornavirus 2]
MCKLYRLIGSCLTTISSIIKAEDFMDNIISNFVTTTKKLLGDPNTEAKEVTSDRIGAVVSSNAATASQAEVNEQTVFNPSLKIRDDMRSQGFKIQTASINPGKLIQLDTKEWSGTAEPGTELIKLELPKAFYSTDKKPAWGQTRFFKLLRTGYTFNIQINVSAGVSGSALAFFAPPGVDLTKYESSGLLMLPSVLINVGVASNGTLRIPYTNYKNYIGTDSSQGGTLIVIVWSKLTIPTGTTNSMSVTVYGSMDDLDMQNPRPRAQGPTRNNVDIGPGPGNLVLAGKSYTNKATDLALCGETAVFDPSTCGCSTPVRNLKQLLTVPLPLKQHNHNHSTWSWASNDEEGKVISKHYLSLAGNASNEESSCNQLLSFLTNSFGMWRGSLVFTLTVMGNPLSKGRLRMCIYPNHAAPYTTADADNSLYVVCDIGLQTSFELVLPYSWDSWMRNAASSANDERLLGMLEVIVNNRLIVTSATPPTLEYMLTCRVGEDFEFIAPVSRGIQYQSPPSESVAVSDTGAEIASTAGLDVLENTDYKNQKVEAPRTLNAEIIPITTVKADHMDIQSLLGRGQRVGEVTLVAGKVQYYNIPLPTEGHMSILKLFAYWAGDLVVSLYNSTDFVVTAAHTYVTGLPESYNSVTAFGSVIVKSKEFASLDVPFYSLTPARIVSGTKALGQLVLHGFGAGDVEVYVSFRRINLYVPVGVPLRATKQPFLTVYAPTRRTRQVPVATRPVGWVWNEGRQAYDWYHGNGKVDKYDARGALLPPSDSATAQGGTVWVRDLTEEGVEPNPGPDTVFINGAEVLVEAEAEPLRDSSGPLDMNSYLESCLHFLPGVDSGALYRSLNPTQTRKVSISRLSSVVCPYLLVHRFVGDVIAFGIYIDHCVITTIGNSKLTLLRDQGLAGDPAFHATNQWFLTAQHTVGDRTMFGCYTGLDMNWLSMIDDSLTPPSFIAWVRLKRELVEMEFMSGIGPVQDMDTLYSTALASNDHPSFAQRAWVATIADHLTGSRWRRDLTAEGIESNPGPNFFCRQNGGWNEYSVLLGGKYLAVGEISGIQMQLIEKDSHGWESAPMAEIMAQYPCFVRASYYTHTQFWSTNEILSICKLMPGTVDAHRKRAIICTILGTAAHVASGQGITDVLGAINSRCKDVAASVAHTVMRVLNPQFIEEHATKLISDVCKAVFRALVRVICYSIVFFSNPTAINAIAMTTLLALDATGLTGLTKSIKDMSRCLFDGDMEGVIDSFITLIVDNLGDTDTTSHLARAFVTAMGPSRLVRTQSALKDFVSVTNAAKGLHFWVGECATLWDRLKNWLSPTDQTEAVKWLNENHEYVSNTMATASDLLSKSGENGRLRDAGFQAALRSTKDALLDIRIIVHRAGSEKIFTTTSQLLLRLCSLTLPPPMQKSPMRTEPVGIMIKGDPGCGKTLFSSTLMAEVAAILTERMNFANEEDGAGFKRWVKTIYPHPVGAEYFDNYSGQFFHMYDDFAQCRDESDVKTICNTMSGAPFTVNMADLTDKGTWYNSQIVIATTNLGSYSNLTSITDAGALKRRFPFDIKIRPATQYCTEDGYLDVKTAIEDSANRTGACWECFHGAGGIEIRQRDMEVFSMKEFAKDVAELWMRKRSIASEAEQILQGFQLGVSTEMYLPPVDEESRKDIKRLIAKREADLPNPFLEKVRTKIYEPMLKATEKQREWMSQTLIGWRALWERLRPWALIAVTVSGVIAAILGAVKAFGVTDSNEPPLAFGDEQRPYGNNSVRGARVEKKKPLVVPQGPGAGQEFAHLSRSTGYFKQRDGSIIHFLGYANHTLMIYGHSIDDLDVVSIHYSGFTHHLGNGDMREIPLQLPGGLPTDTSLIRIDSLPFQFRDVRKYIKDPLVSREGYLLYTTPHGAYTHHVNNVRAPAPLTLHLDSGETEVIMRSVQYETRNEPGMCGGVLVQKINGAWSIVGMHHAGDSGRHGYGVPICATLQVETQGSVSSVKLADTRHYTPTKTKIVKSPVHGAYKVTAGPACLHANDRRLDVPIDTTLLHKAANKYTNNKCDIDEAIMADTVVEVSNRLFGACGRHGEWDILKALNGEEGSNPIDMTTSPGAKYVRMGLTKKDLIFSDDGVLKPTPRFENDVATALQAIREGKGNTTFAATLKDEIRPESKIKMGKTRCVEACPVDFVVAHRMILGSLFSKIYNTDSARTGIAVGINPYVDFHTLALAMKRNWYAGDYQCFDGTLPEGIMRHAVEVLATCHEDPQLVRNLLEPVVVSEHHVDDELWTVEGGMPSGSPCTSVLNSVCNMLIIMSAALESGLHDPGDLVIVTYGDDVLFSTDYPIDSDALCDIVRLRYGMQLTSADKKSLDLTINPTTATFLKRSFRPFPSSAYIVGVLDLESMIQKIMWCHGIESFKDQFRNFTYELVLHGPTVYEEVMDTFKPRLDRYRMLAPTYKQAKEIVRGFFFQ